MGTAVRGVHERRDERRLPALRVDRVHAAGRAELADSPELAVDRPEVDADQRLACLEAETSTFVSMSPGLAAEKLTILFCPVRP